MYSQPVGYFVTFRCYGTWLPGDVRGWIDRQHNRYGEAFLPPHRALEAQIRDRLSAQPCVFDSREREVVTSAIERLCGSKLWILHAVNVRTNHAHVVVSGPNSPSKAITEFKKAVTTKLRASGLRTMEEKIWSRGGSKKYLWNESDIADAVHYVLEQQ